MWFFSGLVSSAEHQSVFLWFSSVLIVTIMEVENHNKCKFELSDINTNGSVLSLTLALNIDKSTSKGQSAAIPLVGIDTLTHVRRSQT